MAVVVAHPRALVVAVRPAAAAVMARLAVVAVVPSRWGTDYLPTALVVVAARRCWHPMVVASWTLVRVFVTGTDHKSKKNTVKKVLQ